MLGDSGGFLSPALPKLQGLHLSVKYTANIPTPTTSHSISQLSLNPRPAAAACADVLTSINEKFLY